MSDQENTQIGCVVPLHRKTLAIGTLKSILNQAGVSAEDFIDKLSSYISDAIKY